MQIFDKVSLLFANLSWRSYRLTDKLKIAELLQTTNDSCKLSSYGFFFEDFWIDRGWKEVMARWNSTNSTWGFKAKLEAMSDEEFVVENIFPLRLSAVQKNRESAKTFSCQSVLLFQEKCTVQNYQTLFSCSVVKINQTYWLRSIKTNPTIVGFSNAHKQCISN